MDAPKRAIVLSGGGARGAYEAGVLGYLLDELPARLGRPVRFDLVSGTSVGAIHACFLAATAHETSGRGKQLTRLWNDMELSDLFATSPMSMLGTPFRLLGMLRPTSIGDHPPDRLAGLLDTSALESLVRKAIPWRKLKENVVEGLLDAVSVTATEVTTGRAVVFVDSHRPQDLHWTRDPSIVSRAGPLTLEHALASAAIPGLFPAVRLDDAYYSDGGLRMNTPLSPVLRMGADRVLVLALQHRDPTDASDVVRAGRVAYSSSPIYLLGKALNALLLEHIDRDLRQLHLMNEILKRAEQVGGANFVDRLNETVERDRGEPFRIVETEVVRPSADLGVLAGQAAKGIHGHARTSPGLRMMLRGMGFMDGSFEADLLSYVFFDRSYTAPLLDLGREDARLQEEALVRFFTD